MRSPSLARESGEGGERLREQLGRRRGEPRRVALGFTHDARPAQEIDGVDAPCGAESPVHGAGVLDQRVQEVGVERELAAGGGAWPDIKRRIDLAAPRRRCRWRGGTRLRGRAALPARAGRPRGSGD